MKSENKGMLAGQKDGNTPKQQGSGRRGKEEAHGATLRAQTEQTGGTGGRPEQGAPVSKSGKESANPDAKSTDTSSKAGFRSNADDDTDQTIRGASTSAKPGQGI